MAVVYFFLIFPLLWIIPIVISIKRKSYYLKYIVAVSVLFIVASFLFWGVAFASAFKCFAARYTCDDPVTDTYAFILVVSYLLCLVWATASKQIKQGKNKQIKKN